MATEMFLKIEGRALDGESTDADHTNEIDVLAWQWGMAQTGTMHVASGGGAGKVQVQDITIVKRVDRASPMLAKHCASGTHFDKATLYVRSTEGEPLEYLTIEMNKVIISGLSYNGSSDRERPEEVLCLNFAEFIMAYDPGDETGGADEKVISGWNIASSGEAG